MKLETLVAALWRNCSTGIYENIAGICWAWNSVKLLGRSCLYPPPNQIDPQKKKKRERGNQKTVTCLTHGHGVGETKKTECFHVQLGNDPIRWWTGKPKSRLACWQRHEKNGSTKNPERYTTIAKTSCVWECDVQFSRYYRKSVLAHYDTKILRISELLPRYYRGSSLAYFSPIILREFRRGRRKVVEYVELPSTHRYEGWYVN